MNCSSSVGEQRSLDFRVRRGDSGKPIRAEHNTTRPGLARLGHRSRFGLAFVIARRALLGERLVGRRELAFWIIGAAVEDVAPPPGLLFDQLAVFALRTFHPDEVLLYVLALGVSAAGGELAVAAMP